MVRSGAAHPTGPRPFPSPRIWCKIERPFVLFPSSPPMSVTALPLKTARGRGGKPLHKGQQTKAAIVDAALSLATQIGLEGLSIGALAEVTQMSKSGVFAHFGSREELQISVVREYHA